MFSGSRLSHRTRLARKMYIHASVRQQTTPTNTSYPDTPAWVEMPWVETPWTQAPRRALHTAIPMRLRPFTLIGVLADTGPRSATEMSSKGTALGALLPPQVQQESRCLSPITASVVVDLRSQRDSFRNTSAHASTAAGSHSLAVCELPHFGMHATRACQSRSTLGCGV